MKTKKQQLYYSNVPESVCKKLGLSEGNRVRAINRATNRDVDALGALKMPYGRTTYFNSWFGWNSTDKLKKITIGGFHDVIYMAGSAFEESKIEIVDMSDSRIEYLGDNCFKNSEIGHLALSQKLKAIPQGLCYECKYLKKIVIPGSVKTVGCNAFKNCTNLVRVVLEHGVTEIRQGAFRNTGLSILTFPQSLERLCLEALKECPDLDTLEFEGFNPKTEISVGECKQGDFDFNDQTWLKLLKYNPRVISLISDEKLFDEEYVSLCKNAVVEGIELRDKAFGLTEDRLAENERSMKYVINHINKVKSRHPEVLKEKESQSKAQFLSGKIPEAEETFTTLPTITYDVKDLCKY